MVRLTFPFFPREAQKGAVTGESAKVSFPAKQNTPRSQCQQGKPAIPAIPVLSRFGNAGIPAIPASPLGRRERRDGMAGRGKNHD